MKKTVAIILVLTNLLVGATGLACESKQRLLNATEQSDLYKLGIMVGDEIGELHLDNTITRAETVKMICVAGNIQPQIPVGQTCSFPDVSEHHWAYQYICAAQSHGLIQGDEDGNFNPESNITNEEIITMIVRLLGYGTRAEQTGGYPGGYTGEATRLGLTSGLQLEVNAPAIRNDVGIMVYQALDVPVMEETGDGEYIILDGQNGVNLKTFRNASVRK